MTTHVWEKVEIELLAQNEYSDPYNQVDVWVDLEGPNFCKRAYGFWDGGNSFKVRVLANAAGEWTWRSGSNQDDAGLNDITGSFTAIDWSDEEKAVNNTRRGFVRPTANGHALEYADGTPFYLLGDTWWAIPSWQYFWYDDEEPRPIGETMGFKDMVKYREKQGYNSLMILAAFPNWVNDGLPSSLYADDEYGTLLRDAWVDPETGSPKAMYNEGGTPFEFPGIIPGYENSYPDVRKLNPAYFRSLDRKIDYLNEHGFTPFMEAIRRDAMPAWFNYYGWPDSYIRYVNYLFARYQANNLIMSPIHFDAAKNSIHPREFTKAIREAFEKRPVLPFGTLVSTNAAPSTLAQFGDDDEAPWLTLHQIGNQREHEFYWLLTQIYHAKKAKPAMHGEPYYSAWGVNVDYYRVRAMPNTPDDDRLVRNGMYGSFLSGALGGYVYGSTGLVRAEREKGCIEGQMPYSYWMWDGLTFTSGTMVTIFKKFVFSEGTRYQELIPNCEQVSPNRTHDIFGFEGWAYCAQTKERDLIMLYFEKDCPTHRVRSVLHDGIYEATWFDPRTGEWLDAGKVYADPMECITEMPQKPTNEDWALKLKLVGQQEMVHGYKHTAMKNHPSGNHNDYTA